MKAEKVDDVVGEDRVDATVEGLAAALSEPGTAPNKLSSLTDTSPGYQSTSYLADFAVVQDRKEATPPM